MVGGAPSAADQLNFEPLEPVGAMKVLIVDDHALIRDALGGLLKKLKRGIAIFDERVDKGFSGRSIIPITWRLARRRIVVIA